MNVAQQTMSQSINLYLMLANDSERMTLHNAHLLHIQQKKRRSIAAYPSF